MVVQTRILGHQPACSSLNKKKKTVFKWGKTQWARGRREKPAFFFNLKWLLDKLSCMTVLNCPKVLRSVLLISYRESRRNYF